MPNWTTNYTSIKGEEKVINEIAEKFVESGFEGWFPTPEELLDRNSPNDKDPEEMRKKYGAPDWYDWNIQNWGTKWNAVDRCIISQYDNEIALSYLTAWSPPIEFWEKLTELYPDIEVYMEFIDEGYCFVGDATIRDGVVIELNEFEGINEQINWFIRKMGITDTLEQFEWVLDEIYEKVGKELGEKIYELPEKAQIELIRIYFSDEDKEKAIDEIKKILRREQ